MRRQTLTLLASAVLALAGCGKYTTLARTSLDATAPLKVTFDGDLSVCDQYLCLLALTGSPAEAAGAIALKKGSRLVRVLADGSWTAFEMADKEAEPEADEAKPSETPTEEAPRPDAPGPAVPGPDAPGLHGSASRIEVPSASAEASASDDADGKKKKKGKKDEKDEKEAPENWAETPAKTYEELKAESMKKAMGNATKEIGKGVLVEADGVRVLELAPALLPPGKFLLYTNGWFGATFEGTRLGSPTRFGTTQVSR